LSVLDHLYLMSIDHRTYSIFRQTSFDVEVIRGSRQWQSQVFMHRAYVDTHQKMMAEYSTSPGPGRPTVLDVLYPLWMRQVAFTIVSKKEPEEVMELFYWWCGDGCWHWWQCGGIGLATVREVAAIEYWPIAWWSSLVNHQHNLHLAMSSTTITVVAIPLLQQLPVIFIKLGLLVMMTMTIMMMEKG